jgi:hypothetical protein
MCSLDESNEAYQYIGLPGYNPHLSRETFYKHLDAEESIIKPRSDHERTMLINARRIFHIAEPGKDYQEREDLARTYFDQVTAVERPASDYLSGDVLMQVYLINGKGTLFGFRPIIKGSYLYHRLRKSGYLIGKFSDLKHRVNWEYMPIGLTKEELTYICAPSYFRKEHRENLAKYDPHEAEYRLMYGWTYWPEMKTR